MKRVAMALLIALGVTAAAPAFADMPYFGATPKDGNWWNSPSHDYNTHSSYAARAARHAARRG
jgi:hypothetical protein